MDDDDFPVTRGQQYKVNLGSTFPKDDNKFYAIQYDFKPLSVASELPSKVTVNGRSVSIEVPTSHSGISIHGGHIIKSEKECFLIFDPKSGTFTLERVTQIPVKHKRSIGVNDIAAHREATKEVAVPSSPDTPLAKKLQVPQKEAPRRGGSPKPTTRTARGRSRSPVVSPVGAHKESSSNHNTSSHSYSAVTSLFKESNPKPKQLEAKKNMEDALDNAFSNDCSSDDDDSSDGLSDDQDDTIAAKRSSEEAATESTKEEEDNKRPKRDDNDDNDDNDDDDDDDDDDDNGFSQTDSDDDLALTDDD